MAFNYTPLNSSELRLLLLQPGEFHARICCSLSTRTLNHNPSYEALSYVWGDPEPVTSISIQGIEVRITPNLAAALQHLRRPHTTRVLWVDALCIDQNSTEEKDTQVPFMLEIYKHADNVIAWLGSDGDDIQVAISWIEYYLLGEPTSRSVCWSETEAKALHSKEAEQDKAMAVLRTFRGCLKVFTNPYWNRMWTFQEFIANDRIPLCVAGFTSFSLSDLLSIQTKQTLSGESPLDLAKEALRLVGSAINRKELQQLVNPITVLNLSQLLNVAREGYSNYFENKETLLYEMIQWTCGRQSTDSKDRIYALYGLIPGIQNLYSLNYGKLDLQVSLEAVAYMINQERVTEIWSSFPLLVGRFDNVGIPSWLVDLNHRQTMQGPGILSQALFGGSRCGRFEMISTDLTTLHSWAKYIGSCNVVGQFSAGQFVSEISGHRDNLHVDLLKALEVVQHSGRRLKKHNVAQRAIIQLFQEARRASMDQSCVIISKSCFGFAPADTRDGDFAIVSPTMDRPLILRKTNVTKFNSSSQYYNLVGPCSLSVVSGGIAIDRDFFSAILQQDLVEYMIR